MDLCKMSILSAQTNSKRLQQMVSSIRERLRFERIYDILQQVRGVQRSSQNFLYQVNHHNIRSEYHLHYLYLILQDKWNNLELQEVKLIFRNQRIIIGLEEFIYYIINRSLGRFTGVSEQTVEEILKLLYMNLQLILQEADLDLKNLQLDNVKTILQHIHSFIHSESRSPRLKQRFLECLAIYRRNGPMINDTMYSEQLSRNEANVDEFTDFFVDYMRNSEQKRTSVIQNLLKGLALRLNCLMENQLKRNKLANLFDALSSFLQDEPKESQWFSNILRWPEYSQIFDSMLESTSKNENYMKLSHIVNKIVQVYMGSKINNVLKFEFITKIFKYIIKRSANFYIFIKTDSLADREFLRWFIRTELKEEKGKELISLYFSSSFALEFLLIVMIYFNDTFPEQAESNYAFMSSIGFLTEAKQFINHDSVRRYLEVFHMQTGHSEEFNDFANRIEDRESLNYFM